MLKNGARTRKLENQVAFLTTSEISLEFFLSIVGDNDDN